MRRGVRRSGPLIGRVGAVLALAAGALVAASVALAAIRTVSVTIGPGYARRTFAACRPGRVSVVSYVHRNRPIVIRGLVRPAPRTHPWHVVVKVRRCSRRAFVDLRKVRVAGRRDGSFRIVWLVRAAGTYAVRAYYVGPGTVRSRSPLRTFIAR